MFVRACSPTNLHAYCFHAHMFVWKRVEGYTHTQALGGRATRLEKVW